MEKLNYIPRFDTHSHSEYSNIRLIDAINKIPDMLKTAAKLGMKGIALTDHECLCGHLKWLEAEKDLKEKEIIPKDFKAALGNEIYLVEDRKNIERYWHYILIAKNDLGHRALRELSSRAWYYSYNSRGMTRVPTEMKELEEIINKYPNSLISTSACFREGTKVVTQNGEKNIEDITKSDYILNKYGQWEKVNFPTQRRYKGRGVEILFCENPTSTVCTENHKFLVTTSNKISYYKQYGKNPLEWVEAKKMNTLGGSSKHICLRPIQEIEYTNNKIIYKKEWKNCLKLNYSSLKTSLKEEILITPEVMRLFGLWLGDGSISINKEKKYYAINFTFSYEEFKYYWDSFVKIASENIGITWSINYRPERGRVDITSHSIELVELFYFLFGYSHAKDKYIPKRLLHITEELDFNLFIGYALADGHFRTKEKNGHSSGEFCSVSISKQLAYDFQKLLTSLHLRSSITISKERVDKNGTHHHTAYYLSSSNKVWTLINKKRIISNSDVIKYKNIAQNYDKKKFIEINGTLYKKVYIKKYKKIELDETVYCLNVNSHSFVCNGVIVHNCLGNFIDDRVLKLVEAEESNDLNEINRLEKEIDEYIKWNINLFGDDFYIEIAAGSSVQQRAFNKRIKDIAKKYNRKIVIGSDAHYLTAEYRNIHKAYLNSKEGEREVDEFYWDAHMMDNDEAYENLKDFYSKDEFIEICNNSMEIYDKIEEYHLTRNPIIPEVKVKNYPKIIGHSIYPTLNALLGSDDIQERYWVNECLLSLQTKKLYNDTYLARLETEADIIKTISNKVEDCLFKYFNTFQHYIDLFWECGSIVGPGRGSAVGFLSNYLLGITQLDPIKWNLHEWRFLNKERVELPDIDIDLSPSKREAIFKKIREERGELNLVQVATFGTEGTRSAIASAGRGYRSELYPKGLPVEVTQYLSNLIPQERGFLPSIDEVLHGNEEKGTKPIQAFIEEVNKYPGLLEIIQGIEGLVCRRGEHASGVMFYNNSPFETNALMRSPNGDITTQFELHDSDKMGDTKFDMLVTEISDKITICIELMQKNNILPSSMSLREIYNNYLHPDKINLKDERLWNALGEGKILDVFQFSTGVGLSTAKEIKPKNPTEMTSANALMRLMGEPGKERPIERYIRIKNDINVWYNEVRQRKLSEQEIKVLEPYYLPNYGVPASQEDLMLVCMDKNIAHFTLKEANSARKIVA